MKNMRYAGHSSKPLQLLDDHGQSLLHLVPFALEVDFPKGFTSLVLWYWEVGHFWLLSDLLGVRPILPDDQAQVGLRYRHPKEGSVEAAASKRSVDVVGNPALTTSSHQLSCVVLHGKQIVGILIVKDAKDEVASHLLVETALLAHSVVLHSKLISIEDILKGTPKVWAFHRQAPESDTTMWVKAVLRAEGAVLTKVLRVQKLTKRNCLVLSTRVTFRSNALLYLTSYQLSSAWDPLLWVHFSLKMNKGYCSLQSGAVSEWSIQNTRRETKVEYCHQSLLSSV